MDYIGIGLCIVAIIAICIVLFLKSRVNKSIYLTTPDNSGGELGLELSEADSAPNKLTIQMEMLPVEAITNENKMIEITDSKVLTHVNNLIPGLAQAGNATNNAIQAVQGNGEVLYRAIIPNGAKLTDSKAMEGAVRGIYHGADGIKGHANLVAVEASKDTAIVTNTVASAMGVASMIVGQYYMTQINVELGVINDGISKISDFQDNEYRSRVYSLVAHIMKIADYQTEILENDELRLSKISQLDSLEEECTKLLGQADLTLADFANRNDLDYSEYEQVLEDAQNWFMYQKSLLEVLYKIADLRYTLHLGAVSRGQCGALLLTYTKQVDDTQIRLTNWHQATTERLKIDMIGIRRKRSGIDGVFHFLPGLLNDDQNFRAIEKRTAEMIAAQTSGHTDIQGQNTTDLYAEDVQLIAKGGKIYYLPKSKEKKV